MGKHKSKRKKSYENAETENKSNNKIEASINSRFFHEAWELIRITCDDHPGPLIVLDFIFVILITVLLLTLLPVPSSFSASSSSSTKADHKAVVIVTATTIPIMI